MNRKKWINRSLKLLFILAMAPPTFGKMSQNEEFLNSFTGLGYPVYLSYILAVAYILSFIAILLPKAKLIKEWAYAGVTFSLTGAFASHLLAGEPILKATWALFTLALLMGAYFSEEGKKLSIK